MQDGGKEVRVCEMLEDRAVHVPNVLLENMIEVADRLMQMKAEDESYGRHRLPHYQRP